MADQTQPTVAAIQDALRPVRMFPGAASGALQGDDATPADTDNGAFNPPRQYQTIGPTGYAVEGTPLSTGTVPTGFKGHAVRNWPMMIIAAAAAVYIVRGHG